MSNGLFKVDGIDLPGVIAASLGPRGLEAVLTVYTIGARDSGNLSAGQAVTAADPAPKARGFWKEYRSYDIDGSKVLLGDRKAVLLGGSNPAVIAALKVDDKITMEGVTLSIVRLEKRDPAAATYTFQCRDRSGPNGV